MKKLSKSQLGYIVFALLCTAIFVAWAVYVIDGIVKVPVEFLLSSSFYFAQLLITYFTFLYFYVLLICLVSRYYIIEKKPFVKAAHRFTVLQVFLTATLTVGAILLIFCLWSFNDNLFNIVIPHLNNIPIDQLGHKPIADISVYMNIITQVILLFFSSTYITLAVKLFMRDSRCCKSTKTN